MRKSTLKLWRTAVVGSPMFRSGEDFKTALLGHKYGVSAYAEGILEDKKFVVTPKETLIRLAIITGVDVGCPKGVSREEMEEKAQRIFSLEFCPCDLAPNLRLQYPAQPKGERLMIGMRAFLANHGRYEALTVTNFTGKHLELRSSHGDPENVWSSDRKWVFKMPY
jgi:hypothetical protein